MSYEQHYQYSEDTVYNGEVHPVCGTCGAIEGHGCPDAESCDCDDELLDAGGPNQNNGGLTMFQVTKAHTKGSLKGLTTMEITSVPMVEGPVANAIGGGGYIVVKVEPITASQPSE